MRPGNILKFQKFAHLIEVKGEASPSSYKMQIGWQEEDFKYMYMYLPVTAKVWANLDNPIKRYEFSKVSLFLCMSPSQVALF